MDLIDMHAAEPCRSSTHPKNCNLATEEAQVSRRLGTESGQAVLVMVALSLPILLGFTGFALDVGTLFRAKRLAQTAADSAAIGGASRLKYSTAPDVTTAAQADAVLNGMTNGQGGSTVTVNRPPLSGPHQCSSDTNCNSYVEVITAQSSPTFFMKVFGWDPVTVGARAVATQGSGQGCIVALGTSGTTFSNSGNTTLSASQCGISVNSPDPSAMSVNGNVTINVGTIGVVGGYSQAGGSASISPTPSTGVAPVSNPLGFLTPPTCSATGSSSTSGGTTTFQPGNYTSTTTINGTSNNVFASGVYCFSGNLKISGNPTISGTGVTFYFSGSASLNMTGGGTVSLSAPTSGTYNGILIYQNPSDTSSISLGGNSGGTIAGVVYAPGAAIDFQGTSGATFYVAIVTKSISIGGTPNVQNYATLNGQSPITAAALVE